jgi:hypothetical protein
MVVSSVLLLSNRLIRSGEGYSITLVIVSSDTTTMHYLSVRAHHILVLTHTPSPTHEPSFPKPLRDSTESVAQSHVSTKPLANCHQTIPITIPITIPPTTSTWHPSQLSQARASPPAATLRSTTYYNEGAPLRRQRRTRAMAQDNGVTKPKKKTKAPAPGPTIVGPGHRMCASCNAIGHIKTNRTCPNYVPRP